MPAAVACPCVAGMQMAVIRNFQFLGLQRRQGRGARADTLLGHQGGDGVAIVGVEAFGRVGDGVPLGGPAVEGNWQLTLSAGNLPSNTVKNTTVTALGAATVTPAGDDKLTLHIVPATGAFSGHFVHPANNQMIQFKGLLLQQPYDIGGGCFLGTNASGQVELLSVP